LLIPTVEQRRNLLEQEVVKVAHLRETLTAGLPSSVAAIPASAALSTADVTSFWLVYWIAHALSRSR
jgi:hypothetical protein